MLLEIKWNARRAPSVANPTTGAAMELDIYLPKLMLSLEFQVTINKMKDKEVKSKKYI